jgi:hypothetical protein
MQDLDRWAAFNWATMSPDLGRRANGEVTSRTPTYSRGRLTLVPLVDLHPKPWDSAIEEVQSHRETAQEAPRAANSIQLRTDLFRHEANWRILI